MSAGTGAAKKDEDMVVASDKLERAKVWGEDDHRRSAGRELLPVVAARELRSRRPSSTKSNREDGWAGTPTRPRRRNTLSRERARCMSRAEPPIRSDREASSCCQPTFVTISENSGTETLRAVAFFAAAMFTQVFDNGDAASEESRAGHAESRGRVEVSQADWSDRNSD